MEVKILKQIIRKNAVCSDIELQIDPADQAGFIDSAESIKGSFVQPYVDDVKHPAFWLKIGKIRRWSGRGRPLQEEHSLKFKILGKYPKKDPHLLMD